MTREQALAKLAALVASPQVELGDSGAARASTAAPAPGDSAEAPPRNSRVAEQLAIITRQLDLLRTVQQAQAEATAANTRALGERAGAALADTAKSVGGSLLGGFGLSPIVSGLIRLFRGDGSSSATPPLSRYHAPESLRIDAGWSGGRLSLVDYGAGDRVRALPPSNVTIQVNAMDSRSFLDRSEDIARAVRQAMLESHAINDVVTEL